MPMRGAIAVAVLLMLGACQQTDPYAREGAWRPNGSNAANLRAMVVVPSDLVAATPAAPADGGLAATAISRLEHDRVRNLPDSGVAQVTPVASGGSAEQPAAAAPAGTGN
jgi:type IV pilus biogenesis protein CpaD/CtpE